MKTSQPRVSPLESLLEERIVILDGAMGTMIQTHNLSEADYRGAEFAGHPRDLRQNNDVLNLTQPQIIEDIHRQYLEAGADIIETNTFNSNAVSMAEYGLQDRVAELNAAGARAARRAGEQFTAGKPERRCFVAGSMGPTSRTASVSQDVAEPGKRAARALSSCARPTTSRRARWWKAGSTCCFSKRFLTRSTPRPRCSRSSSTLRNPAAGLPVMVSVTIVDQSGRTLSGQTIEAFWNSISHIPTAERGHQLRAGRQADAPLHRGAFADRARLTSVAIRTRACRTPLAGFDETPESMAQDLGEFAANGWLNIVGGCCGTTPAHIRAIAEAVRREKPHSIAKPDRMTRLSGLEPLTFRPDMNFVNVGERTNVTGSPKFAKLILNDQFEEALAVALQQVEAGAQIIDINMDEGMLESEQAMTTFLNYLASEPDIARVPIMIDSSKWSVIEAGLRAVQGKGVVNSISLKEGEEAFKQHARLVRRYGAAVIVMAFDERGQADTAERKVEISTRAYRILTEEVGFPPEDIIFDPNILTIATGMEEHANYAVNFIEATRQIKATLPHAKVSGGDQQPFVFVSRQQQPFARRCTRRSSTMPSRPAWTWALSTRASWASMRKSPKTCWNWWRTSSSTGARTQPSGCWPLPIP